MRGLLVGTLSYIAVMAHLRYFGQRAHQDERVRPSSIELIKNASPPSQNSSRLP